MEVNQEKLPKKEFYAKLDRENKEYEAEKEIHNMDERKAVTDHDHEFKMVRGNEVQCTCGWGLFLDSHDEFRSGHVYREGTLIA